MLLSGIPAQLRNLRHASCTFFISYFLHASSSVDATDGAEIYGHHFGDS